MGWVVVLRAKVLIKFKESSAPIKCVPEEVMQSVVSERVVRQIRMGSDICFREVSEH